MNRLLTLEGGQPFTTEDLDFLQTNFEDALNSLVKGLAGTLNCVVSGILSGSTTSAVPGSVYIDGKLYVLKSSVSGGGSKHFLCIEPTEENARTFRDGQNRNIYLVDNAYMSESPSAVSIDLRGVKTLSEIVAGGGGWSSLSADFDAGATGVIEFRQADTGLYSKSQMRVTVNKPLTESNLLWRSLIPSLSEFSAIAIYNNQAFVVVGSTVNGHVYNLDGTPYNGPIVIYQLELK